MHECSLVPAGERNLHPHPAPRGGAPVVLTSSEFCGFFFACVLCLVCLTTADGAVVGTVSAVASLTRDKEGAPSFIAAGRQPTTAKLPQIDEDGNARAQGRCVSMAHWPPRIFKYHACIPVTFIACRRHLHARKAGVSSVRGCLLSSNVPGSIRARQGVVTAAAWQRPAGSWVTAHDRAQQRSWSWTCPLMMCAQRWRCYRPARRPAMCIA